MVADQFHIAIVDDDPAMRRAVARLCGASELPSCSFASAEEFLESDSPELASMLILDINLPGLSGFELHDHLKHMGIELPVVFITGHDQPLNRERARRTGAAAYLTKPFPADLLINAVRSQMPANMNDAFRRPGSTTPTPEP